MKYILLLILLPLQVFSQSEYPQDYFRNPLDITLVLSGSFAELRSNHFHSGLDIKTQQKQGLKVYTAADGYVSRIKVSHFGYGKALYITHPNGYTTVYAHLKKFSPKIEAYVKKRQYEKESYEVEFFPNTDELLISRDEIVAFSGNTGGSGGPHLHFEIRDNAERPINPMLFGINIKDTKKPFITGVYAYPKNKTSFINGENKRTPLRLIPNANGDYSAEKISAYGDIGFGVVTNDRQDLAPNKNGVSNIKSFFNGNKVLEVNFKRFSFDETKHLNRYVDFELFKTKKTRVQKLFIEANNPLSLFKGVVDNGYIKIEDSTASIYKVEISDYKNNTTTLDIPIKGEFSISKNENLESHPNLSLIKNAATTVLEGNKSSVIFYNNTVYDDLLIDFKVNSDTISLHKDIVPLQKNFIVNYDISNYKDIDKDKLFIARLFGYYKKPSYVSTTRKGDTLSARSKIFGQYVLATDTITPKIRPVNFTPKKWLSKYRYLKVKISDDLSGISNYRATVNGKWILMEYDYKTGLLTHDFNDNVVTDTENNLKIIVTDNVGNSSTFEATFFRK
ncbi:M23 family metallopeptidase [Winogradskyella immobilis]|uniref:M23 family metallopeptidase n=1 Tax=Winogradskyella immobilis TaxID=2816852 RepID=A0ABS8EMD4_9FLAO|nr:M23 family metallopeptidase [Winogradskyella immobilis]MCC1483725.1 M23 family metallopeptidase [Winogradskyella immobilis]MCG0015819.1 M23 family metallopeptidase [Winogradskyella immobilis]